MPFEQVRHRPPAPLAAPRELVVACAPLRSNVNLSTIVRTAGCCAVSRVIACGNPRLDRTVARDGADSVRLEVRNSLPPVLRTLRAEGYRLVGLEQTTNSTSLHSYRFVARTALVIGNERAGLAPEALDLLDDCVEIPVWGLPYSYNVATATAMTLYEYCRQFPS
ncbi:MAG TPA: RNA methyltransferase [Jatrophihabitans sp.]|nr:RNA methyltransferase [Jatrophihabitans sp.]